MLPRLFAHVTPRHRVKLPPALMDINTGAFQLVEFIPADIGPLFPLRGRGVVDLARRNGCITIHRGIGTPHGEVCRTVIACTEIARQGRNIAIKLSRDFDELVLDRPTDERTACRELVYIVARRLVLGHDILLTIPVVEIATDCEDLTLIQCRLTDNPCRTDRFPLIPSKVEEFKRIDVNIVDPFLEEDVIELEPSSANTVDHILEPNACRSAEFNDGVHLLAPRFEIEHGATRSIEVVHVMRLEFIRIGVDLDLDESADTMAPCRGMGIAVDFESSGRYTRDPWSSRS